MVTLLLKFGKNVIVEVSICLQMMQRRIISAWPSARFKQRSQLPLDRFGYIKKINSLLFCVMEFLWATNKLKNFLRSSVFFLTLMPQCT